jgi:hypothetical protein
MTVLADQKAASHSSMFMLMGVMLLALMSSGAYAAPASAPAATATSGKPAATPAATAKPAVAAAPARPSMETQIANLSKQVSGQATRLGQLEAANQEALAKNQTLQLENDNLKVQVKVLQSDRGAQMFIYGAVAILIGALIGYICANYFSRRNRRW